MRSSALCSSAKTVVAPTSSTTALISPAIRPLSGSLALRSSASTAVAPSRPTRPGDLRDDRPCAASRPNSAPAIAITITSSGASEKIV